MFASLAAWTLHDLEPQRDRALAGGNDSWTRTELGRAMLAVMAEHGLDERDGDLLDLHGYLFACCRNLLAWARLKRMWKAAIERSVLGDPKTARHPRPYPASFGVRHHEVLFARDAVIVDGPANEIAVIAPG